MIDATQIAVFLLITGFIGLMTWVHCRGTGDRRGADRSAKDYFLASGGLSWLFVAGSITLTNLSTDQLVGMNGSQVLLVAWWELAAVIGLIILAFVFIPIYYRNNCTTTTELLEKRYNNKHIRAIIAVLFLLGNLFIYLPAVLYSGSLFMQSMLGLEPNWVVIFSEEVVRNEAGIALLNPDGREQVDIVGISGPLLTIAAIFAVTGAGYAILGGLRAVAVSDTYSGVGILLMALIVVYLALKAVDFDILTDVPIERLSLIGQNFSDIPWHTLLTGMILIQIYYWSTNQTITQRAMAAKSVKEAQRGVLTAAGIRLLIIPLIVTVPGVVAFKLYGDIGDAAYGQLIGDILPNWMSGAFAAMMAAAVLTTFNSILNSSAALYVCDLHQAYFKKNINVPRVSAIVQLAFVALSVGMVIVFAGAESLIALIQKLNGLLSMPVLSAFVVGLVFRNVHAGAAVTGLLVGLFGYGMFIFGLQPAALFMLSPPAEFATLTGEALRSAAIDSVPTLFKPFASLSSQAPHVFSAHYIHAMAITFVVCVSLALLTNRMAFGRPVELRFGDNPHGVPG